MGLADRLLDSAQGYGPLMAGAFVFLAVAMLTVAVLSSVLVRRDVRRRAATGLDETLGRRSARRDSVRAAKHLLDRVSRHFVPTDPQEVARLRRKLQQAGFLAPSAMAWFFAVRAGLALILGVAAFFALPEFLDDLSFTNHWLFVGGTAVLGYVGPTFYLDRRIKRLAQQHRDGFPDFMDLMVVCADAGLSMEAAIDRVSRELAETYPSLSANLYMATLELRAGRTLGHALEQLGDRLGIEEARSFATLLQQSEELGSSLTEALRVYSDDMRHKRLSRAEEKAYALPAKLVLPLGVFIFPILFVVILLPAYVRVRSHF